MNAMKNLIHFAVLAVWALMGAVFTLKVVFGGGPIGHGMFTAASFWLWFAGFAAVTTWLVKQSEKVFSSLLVHSGAFVVLAAIPAVFPLHLLRLGLDLLRNS